MKQLYNYNHLVRTYYRTKNKLQKLFAEKKDTRKQDILKRRLQKLFAKISSFQFPVKRSIAAGVITASVFLLPHTAKAQIIFEQHPALNPFGLSSLNNEAKPALIDLDNDGDLDLMRGDNTSFSYFQNFGTAGVPIFDTSVINPFSLTFPSSDMNPAFADLDADGDLDMIAGALGNFYYFENTGTASAPAFAPPVENPYSLYDIGVFAKPSLADLDGDGDFDLLVINSTDLYYFENTGTSSEPEFASAVTDPFGIITEGFHFYWGDAAVSDLDADGDLDLLVTASGDTSLVCPYFFENTGSSTAPAFAASVKDPFELQGSGNFTFGDIDDDGDVDMVSDLSSGIVYFENYGSPAEPDFNTASIPPLGDFRLQPALADMDADGDLDLLSGETGGYFEYFENAGSAEDPAFHFVYAAHPFYGLYVEFGFEDDSAPAFTDLDDDGDIDLMAGDVYGDFYYFENLGTAEDAVYDLRQKNPFSLSTVNWECRPAFGDIDHDGDMDILAGDEDGNFGFFRNIGTASAPLFDEMLLNPFSLDGLDTRATPAFADLDNDGDLDMMSGEGNGNLYYYQNIGTMASPHFDAPQMNTMSLGNMGYNSSLAFGDLDNDSDMDMIVKSAGGQFFYYRNIPDISATFYIDDDGDGFGDPHLSARIISGILPAGFTANNTDCDDNNALINSGAPEICNGLDDNCSGTADEGLVFSDYYADADMDSYGDTDAVAINACASVADAVTNNTDCDDADAAVNPAATEVYNLIDDDCDGSVDEGTVAIQNINIVNQNQFIIYPNPAQNEFIITCNFTNKNNCIVVIKIIDPTGRILLETRKEMMNGIMEKTIPISNKIEAGLYYVEVQSDKSSQTLPLIIIK